MKTWWLVLLGVVPALVGLAAANRLRIVPITSLPRRALASTAKTKHKAPAHKGSAGRPPSDLPLKPRPMLTPVEAQAWQWLQQVFPEHHITIKVPITRFTLPTDTTDIKSWLPMLNTLYCTFTLCDSRGRVIGCFDVVSERPLSRRNRQIKDTVLTKCGMHYATITRQTMSDPANLRAQFLDMPWSEPEPEAESHSKLAELQAASNTLYDLLDRRRSNRQQTAPAPLEDLSDNDTHMGRSWEQPDSFLATLGPIGKN